MEDADCDGFVANCDVDAVRAALSGEAAPDFKDVSDTPPEASADALSHEDAEDARPSASQACAVRLPGSRARQPQSEWAACIGLAALVVRRRRRSRLTSSGAQRSAHVCVRG